MRRAAVLAAALALTACSQPTSPQPAAETTSAARSTPAPWSVRDPHGWRACELAEGSADVDSTDDVRPVADEAAQTAHPELRVPAVLLFDQLTLAEQDEDRDFAWRLRLQTMVIEWRTACVRAGYPG